MDNDIFAQRQKDFSRKIGNWLMLMGLIAMLALVAARFFVPKELLDENKLILGMIFGCAGIVVGIGYLCRNPTLLENK